MSRFRTGKFVLTLVGLILLLWAGCGKRQTVIYDHPEMSPSGYYEKAWVEPKIVISDSLFTLIRADFVDSFYVEEPPDLKQPVAPSLFMPVLQTDCFVVGNIIDDRGEVVRPLIAQKLRYGYYQLTINEAALDPSVTTGGVLYIKVNYCGFEVVEQVVVR